MDTFSDLTTFTYQGEKYKTSDGGGDGVMNFGFYEVSKKDYKTAFWLKDTMSKQDKKIAKIIPWWKRVCGKRRRVVRKILRMSRKA